MPLRGGYPILRQSRTVRGQVESRLTSRSSSREEIPPRKRPRHEYRDLRGRVDPREVPQVFSVRDVREIRGMLRSRGRTPYRPYTPRSSETDPVVEGYSRSSNLHSRPARHDRTQLEVGRRGAAEHAPYREDRYRSGREKTYH